VHVQACCGRFLSPRANGEEDPWPETAEALMRSRYTAYYQGNIEWLWRTLHPQNPQFVAFSGRRKPAWKVCATAFSCMIRDEVSERF
jgi:uncharacterized protein YchJ